MISKPSDVGDSDDSYNLPTKKTFEHIAETKPENNGYLFPMEALTLQERQKARKNSIDDRINLMVEKIKSSSEIWLVWCNLNEESDKAVKVLRENNINAIEVKGSDSPEFKEKTFIDFANGKIQCLVTKGKIAGFGMNWQICHKMAFLGLSDSYELIYQCERRCYRFGQKKEVEVHIFLSDTEGSVMRNIERKERDHKKMIREMVNNMKQSKIMEKPEYTFEKKHEIGNATLYHGDCVEVAKSIPDNSIHYSIFSPPFSSLYVYSNSERDMGNSKNDLEFAFHFKFLIKELYRILKSGRLVSIHCMNIPSMKERDGFIGLKDFRGDIIRWFQDEGFIFHSEVCIWKDPLTEATRTKALGLMHKQLCKDSTMCRNGIPDYLVTMRKRGDNKERVNKPDGFNQFVGENPPNGGVLSHEIWRRYASPVWMDINQSRTLQKNSARDEKDERHICPLQLDVIERATHLWTNENDIVFSPFMGIGSEGYIALQNNRRFIGAELKDTYFKQAYNNLHGAQKQMTLSL